MPPRHLFAADIAARRVFALKNDSAAPTPSDPRLDGFGGRIAELETVVHAVPSPATIWSSDRPGSRFGSGGGDLVWTHTADGVSTSYALPGRISTAATRWRIEVGGVPQAPSAFSLPSSAPVIVFTEAPPAGVSILCYAPFYGAAS